MLVCVLQWSFESGKLDCAAALKFLQQGGLEVEIGGIMWIEKGCKGVLCCNVCIPNLGLFMYDRMVTLVW